MKLSLLVSVVMSHCLLIFIPAFSQDKETGLDRVLSLPSKFFNNVNQKTVKLEERLTKQTGRYLHRLARHEQKLKRKFSKKDTAAAQNLFAGQERQYQQLAEKIKSKAGAANSYLSENSEYLPNLDTLTTSLKFLSQYGNSLLSNNQQLGNLQL